MAQYGSSSVGFILADGYDLTGDLNELQDEGVEPITERRTSFGDSWERDQYIGLSRALGLKHKGFLDDAALGSLEAIQAGQGASRQFSYSVEGNTIGKRFVSWGGALQTKYARLAEVLKLHRIAAEYKGNGEQYDATILHALGAETIDGNSHATSVDGAADTRALVATIVSSSVAAATEITTSGAHDLATGDVVVIAGHSGSTPSINGERTVTVTGTTTFTIPVTVTVGGTGGTATQASTASGGCAIAHITAYSGFSSVVLKVRHSADNSSFSDLATLTFTAAGAQKLALASTTTVHRYLACAWDVTGTGSATVLVGFARRRVIDPV